MKKFFFIASMLFIITVFAQAQETPKETTKVSTEINSVVSNFYDKTTEAIKSLAESLKVPAEHVYEILVKQQMVDSITIILIFIIGLLSIIVLYYLWKWALVDKRFDKSDGASVIIPIILSILVAIMLIYPIANIDRIVTGFINPEYGAIQDILEVLK